MRSKSYVCLAIAALFLALPAAGQNHDHNGPLGIPDDFTPPGELYDNDVSNGTTSLASQDSDGTFNIRSADDFTIDGADCDSNMFEITRVRAQITQNLATPQPMGFEFYDGDMTSPLPTNAAVPVAGPLVEDVPSRIDLGPFGALNLFEVTFPGGGTVLDGDTIYWSSAFGTDSAANAGAFNNFWAASDGAVGTVANAQIFSPDFGIPTWVAVETVIGGPPLAYSFAIDGFCIVNETPTVAIPTLNSWGLLLLVGLLAAASMFFMARTRRVN